MAGDDDYNKYGPLPSWNIVVICTVGGVLFFEALCHQMNAAAKGKKHAMELLEGLYRELAILGVVAFVLWSINVSDAVTIEYNDKHLFEAIHMTLFLAALFHSFFVGLVALYSRQITRRWDIFEDDEMRRYKDLKQLHRRTAQQLGIRHASLKRGVGFWHSAWLGVRHPVLSRRLSELSEHVSYHALRSQFIKSNQLPKNFRFASYLKKCEQDVVIHLAEIKHIVWVLFVLAVGVELYVKGLMGEAESNADVKGLFLFAAALVMAFAIGIHFKLKHIYNTLVRSYQASNDRREDFNQFFAPDATALMRQQDMFWFGKPELMLSALQGMQFLLAVMVGALIWFGTGDSTGLIIVAEIFLAAGAFIIYAFVLPKFIPKFTKVTHVGGMVNRQILSETLKKQKKVFQRRALPPTLRQVSDMARMKAHEEIEQGVLVNVRKFMSGHIFREVVQVVISIHFFIVAYNTDPVEKHEGLGNAWIAEMTFAGIGLFLELATHIVVWRGSLCFNLMCYVPVEHDSGLGGFSSGRLVGTPSRVNSAVVYPSSSRRNLLDNAGGKDIEDNSNQGKTLSVAEEGGEDGKMKHPFTPPSNKQLQQQQQQHELAAGTHGSTRCTFWGCFGWNGRGPGGGCFGGIPPQAAVGMWRTFDFLLVLAVTGCAIATGLVDGSTREWVHAIQGIVLLRLWPLMSCPLPPAAGHDDLHDVDGATVHHAPLTKHSREAVLEETLSLLRKQTAQEGSFDSRLLMAQTEGTLALDDQSMGFDDTTDAEGYPIKKKQAVVPGTDADEKDQERDGGGGSGRDRGADGIANVGVAMALREACTTHPELVKSHGPLSAPILRAMLGLDPYRMAKQDDTQALAVAARAVELARGLNPEEDATAGNVMEERLRRQSSAAAPPSPGRSSSSSSSEMSSGDEMDVRDRKPSNMSARSRMTSFLGGGSRTGRGHNSSAVSIQNLSRHQQQHQQPLQHQAQQQLLYQQQLQYHLMQQHQQQMQHMQLQLQQQHISGAGVAGITAPGGGFAASVAAEQHSSAGFDSSGVDDSQIGPLLSEMQGVNNNGSVGDSFQPWVGAPHAGFLGSVLPPAFEQPSSRSAAGPSSVAGSSKKKAKSRSRSRRRSASGAKADKSGVVMAAAYEDLERPMLPSFASSTGSQHGPSGGGGGGAGYGAPGGIPFSSGRSVPYSSGHRSAGHGPRGTPARASGRSQAAAAAAASVAAMNSGNDSAASSDVFAPTPTDYYSHQERTPAVTDASSGRAGGTGPPRSAADGWGEDEDEDGVSRGGVGSLDDTVPGSTTTSSSGRGRRPHGRKGSHAE